MLLTRIFLFLLWLFIGAALAGLVFGFVMMAIIIIALLAL